MSTDRPDHEALSESSDVPVDLRAPVRERLRVVAGELRYHARGMIAVVTVLLAAACGYAAITTTWLGDRVELATIDGRYHVRGQSSDVPQHVVVVATDGAGFLRLGADRETLARRYAQVVRAAHAAGARAVVLDVDLDGSGKLAGSRAIVEPVLGRALRESGPVVLNDASLPDLRPDVDGTVRTLVLRERRHGATRHGRVQPTTTLAALAASGIGHAKLDDIPDRITLSHGTRTAAVPTLRAADVLAGRQLGELAGRTVFVGDTSGSLREVYHTPFEESVPQVLLHAEAFEEVRSDTWLSASTGISGPCMAFALVGAWVLALTRLPLGRGVAVATGITGAWVLVALFGFIHLGLVAPIAGPVLTGVGAAFGLLISVARHAVHERRTLASTFARYVAPDVAKALTGRSAFAQVASGQRRTITALFADVRGFTSMSEDADPEAIVAQLNDYLSAMVDAIHSCGGTIDKFMGDGIMALFNAPLDQPDHADRACEAAHAMLIALDRLNARRRIGGLEPLRIGIGLATGTAIVGSIGSRNRLDFTAIGDCVNLASRLEAATAWRGVPMLASGSVRDAATRTALDSCGLITVRGRLQPTEVLTFPSRNVLSLDESAGKRRGPSRFVGDRVRPTSWPELFLPGDDEPTADSVA